MVENSQQQRFNFITHSYSNMPCLDCIIFRFSTVVINDKILQVSIYTFLTLRMYKFIVWLKSSLNSLRVCTVLECYSISNIDIWIETNSLLGSVLDLS